MRPIGNYNPSNTHTDTNNTSDDFLSSDQSDTDTGPEGAKEQTNDQTKQTPKTRHIESIHAGRAIVLRSGHPHTIGTNAGPSNRQLMFKIFTDSR